MKPLKRYLEYIHVGILIFGPQYTFLMPDVTQNDQFCLNSYTYNKLLEKIQQCTCIQLNPFKSNGLAQPYQKDEPFFSIVG